MINMNEFKILEKNRYSKADLFKDYGDPGCVLKQDGIEFKFVLDEFVKLKPKNVLEIGSWEGGTLFYYLKYSSPETRIVSIDINHNGTDCKYRLQNALVKQALNEKTTSGEPRLQTITGDSTTAEVFAKAKEVMPEIDFLMIDGIHDNMCFVDWVMYSSLVKKGGIICLHDIFSRKPNQNYVDKLWAVIKNQYTSITMIPDKEIYGKQTSGMGVIYV